MLPEDLLTYLPAYRVVVCARCQYAVQPNAISRHLKDIHHIYRSYRQPFMQYVSKLDLEEPHRVIQLRVLEFPVPLLPVQDGLKCGYENCSHLCVTEKRMKSHWNSVHGQHERTNLDWHSVPLQTFFRGNLLHYFTKDPSNVSCINSNNTSNSEGGEKESSVKHHVNQNPVYFYTELHRSSIFDEVDSALLDHYIEFTCMTIANDPEKKILWKETVPQLAHRHPFLMHGILACSALHRAHSDWTQRRGQIARASSHQERAVSLFRSEIANLGENNCDAVAAFAYLLVINSFASEQEDEQLLLVNSTGPETLPSWLYFLRSECSIFSTVLDHLKSGPVRPLAYTCERFIEVPANYKSGLVEYLLTVIPSKSSQDAWSDEVCQTYRDAAVELGKAFYRANILDDDFTTRDALDIWPAAISIDYLKLLSSYHPGALILLAHYGILLRKVDSHWYFDGRATRLLSTILQLLDVRWHRYVRWLLEDTGNYFLINTRLRYTQ